MELDTGRSHQKHRTRGALLAAAKSLMHKKKPVSVETVADAAKISRATAYRYFTSADYLVREALLDTDWAEPATVIGDATDVRERVRRVQAYLHDFTARNEMAHRLFLAKALEAWVTQGGKADKPLRGGRRVPMYELALEPLRHKLSSFAFRDLVLQLSAASGIEAFVALRDVCGADAVTARQIAESNVLAILDQALMGVV
jgi:AcrR family transcriptional regulator